MGSLKEQDKTKITKSVCIIGAGCAGLATISNILKSNSKHNNVVLNATVFERASAIGGVWNYDEELAQSVFNTPMYTGLRINLPKQVMRFIDFSSDHYDTEDTYPTQQKVSEYLNKYAAANHLMSHIKLNSTIKRVKPIFQDGAKEPKWNVTVESTQDPSENSNFEFDSLIICTGGEWKHKFSGNYEIIRNGFKGQVFHSYLYNKAESFKDQTVLLIGGGPSARDLGIEISRHGKQVYVSLHDYDTQAILIPETCKNLKQIREIKIAKEYSLVTDDGFEFECDVIIFCTGYEYDYPFMEPGILEVSEKGKHVTPIYLHMIHMKYPSLCVLGVADIHFPFYLSDCQSRFYLKYLVGDIKLPTEPQMIEFYNEERTYRKKFGFDGLKSHFFHGLQWEYMRKMGQECGFYDEIERDLPWFQKIHFTCLAGVFLDPFNFRKRTFEDILKDSEKSDEDPTHFNLDLVNSPFRGKNFSFPTDSK